MTGLWRRMARLLLDHLDLDELLVLRGEDRNFVDSDGNRLSHYQVLG